MLRYFIFLLVIVQVVLCQHESIKRCARAASTCMLAAEAMEGPYYWNTTVRQDISEGQSGIPVRLSITVLNTNTCTPIADALVDLWHCDTTGVYSHYLNAGPGPMGGKTDNSTFLRGQQVTNSKGIATFNTIYPGWYPGRATHMHIKVHIGASLTNVDGAIYAKGGHVSHTGQLFFDDTLTDTIATISPYSAHTLQRVRNNEDKTYADSNGGTMIIDMNILGNNFNSGMTGEITVGVDPTATPPPTGFGPPSGGVRPPRPTSTTP